mgnify:CR=1 FL=1
MTQTEITLIVNHDDLDDHWMILIIFSAPVRSLPAADTADTDCSLTSSSRLHRRSLSLGSATLSVLQPPQWLPPQWLVGTPGTGAVLTIMMYNSILLRLIEHYKFNDT